MNSDGEKIMEQMKIDKQIRDNSQINIDSQINVDRQIKVCKCGKKLQKKICYNCNKIGMREACDECLQYNSLKINLCFTCQFEMGSWERALFI